MSAAELLLVHRSSGDPNQSQALGPYRIEALLTEAEEGAGTAYRVRIEPHQRTAVSYHKLAEEFYFVLAGRGTALLNGQPHELRAGDFLRLPPGTTHGFVTGEAALVFQHLEADARFGASVFWTRRSGAIGGEQAMVEYWQVRREGGRRGIIEIVTEGS